MSNCSISSTYTFNNVKYNQQNAQMEYVAISIMKSISDSRIWNFKLNLLPKSDIFQIRFNFINCTLPKNTKLSEIRFNGDFSGQLSVSSSNLFLNGNKSSFISYNWNKNKFEFTIFFRIPNSQNKKIFADLTLKDGCDVWDWCYWCPKVSYVFNGCCNEAECEAAAQGCAAACELVGGGPEDPFADICATGCEALGPTCSIATEGNKCIQGSSLC
jgi:hypothetical protein